MWGLAAVRLLIVLLLGLVLGTFLHRPSVGVLITLALYSAWQLVKLFRLDHWLRHRSLTRPPVLGGVWDDVVTQVVRLYRRKRYHKGRFVQLLRELRESTAGMPDGVVLLNRAAEIVWYNPTAAQLLGLRRRHDLGIRVENLVRAPAFVQHLREGDYALPVILRSPVSPETHLSIHVVPYGNEQKLLLVRDVTRHRQLEQLRKDFVANASHELRSPLTVISGYLETITSEPGLAPELEQPLLEMRRQAERMTAIIHDLLELSQLEASDSEVGGEPIDVGALAAQLRKDVLARAEHPASIELRLESASLLRGDEAQIHSAFHNLVDNAVKYTPATGSITLRWWVDEAGGHFSIEDTGIGIAAEHIQRLTERFYRVDEGRSRASGGSGLGLAIVKHVLQRHGARLEIESQAGRGSRFTCHFPARRVVPAETQSRAVQG
jgi:two-component system phosphate regulon sensor histidine kinase PhoR